MLVQNLAHIVAHLPFALEALLWHVAVCADGSATREIQIGKAGSGKDLVIPILITCSELVDQGLRYRCPPIETRQL